MILLGSFSLFGGRRFVRGGVCACVCVCLPGPPQNHAKTAHPRGTVPGAVPGVVLGTVPGTVPGAVPGTVPGTVPGAVPGAVPGTVPGTVPGAVPGTTPKLRQDHPKTTPRPPIEKVPNFHQQC